MFQRCDKCIAKVTLVEVKKKVKIGRSSFINLIGHAIPFIAAVIAIPLLIKSMGEELFGALTIILAIMGVFSIFDFGIGRTVTKLISERLGSRKISDIKEILNLSIYLNIIISLVGVLVVIFGINYIIEDSWAGLSKYEINIIRNLMAIAIPVVILNGTFRGVLEAFGYFDTIAIIRSVTGTMVMILPFLVWTHTLSFIYSIGVIVCVRGIELITYCLFVNYKLINIDLKLKSTVKHLRDIASFAGWMSISNILSSITLYFDRFILNATVSLSSVAYYVTPFEMLNRLTIIPGAIAGVLFPELTYLKEKDKEKFQYMYIHSIKIIYIITWLLFMIIILFANNILSIWVGDEFANNSATVMQLIALGMFVNCNAYVPYALIQASGRPDLTAKLSIFETIIFPIAIYYTAVGYGINGVALVFAVRGAVNTLLLFKFGNYYVNYFDNWVKIVMPLVGFLTLLVLSIIQINMYHKVILVLLGTIVTFILLKDTLRNVSVYEDAVG